MSFRRKAVTVVPEPTKPVETPTEYQHRIAQEAVLARALDLVEMGATFDQWSHDLYYFESFRGRKAKIAAHLDISYQVIYKYWLSINRDSIRDEEAAHLYRTYSYVIPNLQRTLHQYSHKKLPKDIYKQLEIASEGLMNSVRNAQLSSAVGARSKVKELSFKPFPSASDKVAEKLYTLEELWETAKKRQNTVEDEYFLEQVSTRYLPEAFNAVASLNCAPENDKTAAEGLLLEQINLIEAQLAAIVEKTFAANLMELQVQVDFLRSRNESVTA